MCRSISQSEFGIQLGNNSSPAPNRLTEQTAVWSHRESTNGAGLMLWAKPGGPSWIGYFRFGERIAIPDRHRPNPEAVIDSLRRNGFFTWLIG